MPIQFDKTHRPTYPKFRERYKVKPFEQSQNIIDMESNPYLGLIQVSLISSPQTLVKPLEIFLYLKAFKQVSRHLKLLHHEVLPPNPGLGARYQGNLN